MGDLVSIVWRNTSMKANVAFAIALFAIVGAVVTADFSDDFVADQAEFVQNEADASPMVTTAVSEKAKKPLSDKARRGVWKSVAPVQDGGYSKKHLAAIRAAKAAKAARKNLSPAARARIYHHLHGKDAPKKAPKKGR